MRQISEFMGKSLSDDVIEKIATASTFKAMKKNPTSNPDSVISSDGKTGAGSFMRKGIEDDGLFSRDSPPGN